MHIDPETNTFKRRKFKKTNLETIIYKQTSVAINKQTTNPDKAL